MLEVIGLGKQVSPYFNLSNIHFRQDVGEKLAIAGSSGSGKSTLLQLIAGHQSADTGSIHLFGKRVAGPHEQLIPGHPGLAYLSQQPELPHHYFVHELFSYANQWEGGRGRELFEWCRIDHLMDRKHTEISGGEQQRIALALLLISSPRWLLLDEPFSHLDAINQSILQQVLDDVSARLSITCLLCSHQPDHLFSWANRLLILRDGAMVAAGSPSDLYQRPADAYVAGLLGEFELLSPEHANRWKPAPQQQNSFEHRMIRPENLVFSTTAGSDSLPCQVISSQFAGKGNVYQVNCEGKTYRFFDIGEKWTSGMNGYLSLRKS